METSNSSAYTSFSLPSENPADSNANNWFGSVFDGASFDARLNQYNDALDRMYNAEQSYLAFQRESQFNSAEAEKNRQFNSAEAEKQRAFEKDMSDTAYQRAMADMQKAGLNPLLAYQQGGASTPSVSAASGSAASSSSSGGYSQSKASSGRNNLSELLNIIVPLASGAYGLGLNSKFKIKGFK